jgi:hypothetical protein
MGAGIEDGARLQKREPSAIGRRAILPGGGRPNGCRSALAITALRSAGPSALMPVVSCSPVKEAAIATATDTRIGS